MLINILNENLKKIDLLRKYTFVQYIEKFREIGEFVIHAQLIEENIYLLDRKQNLFVLFDNEIFGKIEKISVSDDFEYEQTIEIGGRLSTYILKKRIIDGTIKYKGNTAGYIKSLIEREFVNTETIERKINMSVEFDNESRVDRLSSNLEKEKTGGYVWEETEPYLTQDKLGIFILPIVRELHVVNGIETNISGWRVVISAGTDRTQFNADQNEAFIFSKSFSNISRTDYEKDNTEYCGVAYIVGEGEGSERKWYVKYRDGEKLGSGWNRDELWIDARDIQSESGTDEEGNEKEPLTPEEYEELIDQRVAEKFSECEKSETYSATISNDKKRIEYKKNIFLGDWVTIRDESLGINIDAQIVQVTISEQNSQRIVDLSVEYVNTRTEGMKLDV